jgi:hypothetical protein
MKQNQINKPKVSDKSLCKKCDACNIKLLKDNSCVFYDDNDPIRLDKAEVPLDWDDGHVFGTVCRGFFLIKV